MTVCPSGHSETCTVVAIPHLRKVIPQRLAASSPPSPARRVLRVPDRLTPPRLPLLPPGPSRPRARQQRSRAPPPPSWDPRAEFGPLRPSPPLLGPLPPNLQKGLTALQPLPPPPPHRPRLPAARIAAGPAPGHWPPHPFPAPRALQSLCVSRRPLCALPRPSRQPRRALRSSTPTAARRQAPGPLLRPAPRRPPPRSRTSRSPPPLPSLPPPAAPSPRSALSAVRPGTGGRSSAPGGSDHPAPHSGARVCAPLPGSPGSPRSRGSGGSAGLARGRRVALP